MDQLEQEVLDWGLALIIGIPLLVIVLNEAIERFQRQKAPLAGALHQVRDFVLPLLTLWVVMARIFSLGSENTLLRIVATLLCVSIIYAGLSLLGATLTVRKKRAPFQLKVPSLYLLMARAGLVLIIGAYILANIWAINLGQIATALGVGSLVVALALQDTLSNLVSGFLLLLDKPFDEGDWLRIDTIEGEVLEMTWRAIRLKTRDEDIIVIPNGELGKKTIENYTIFNPLHAERVSVSFSYDDPPNRVRQILLEAAAATEGIAMSRSPKARIKAYENFLIRYEVKFYITEYHAKDDINNDLMARIYYIAKRNNLAIPLPMQLQYSLDTPPMAVEISMEQIQSHLEELPYFSFVDPRILSKVAQRAIFKDYAVGEYIVKAGASDQGLFIIWHGVVSLLVNPHTNDGNSREVFQLSKGDCFGERSLLRGQPSLVDIKVIEDLQAVLLPVEVLMTLAEQNARFSIEMNQLITNREKSIQLTQRTSMKL